MHNVELIIIMRVLIQLTPTKIFVLHIHKEWARSVLKEWYHLKKSMQQNKSDPKRFC